MAMILGIETSCDETAAALVTQDGFIKANVVASQADVHAKYGGVVPEIASRRHLELIAPVIREALGEAGATLDELDRIAVTQGPGLIGALLVGLAAAKAVAWSRRLPLVPVDHLQGHVASLYLEPNALEPPFLCLLASGGHTLLLDVRSHTEQHLLGTTLDDAAGEAFDKGARLLGLSYPGGRELDLLARRGDDLAASYQRAIVRALVARVQEAAEQTGAEQVAVVGGVAANSELREALAGAALAPLPLCTDNAAMIASAARFAEPVPYPGYLGLDAYASRHEPLTECARAAGTSCARTLRRPRSPRQRCY